jgi:hypothetical protein
MRTLLVVLLVCLSISVVTSEQVDSPSPYYTINSGNGLYALELGAVSASTLNNLNAQGRIYLDSGNPERKGLSYNLPRAFTFECWVLMSQPSDGRFKTIVSRSGPGPKGMLHNKYTDFVLQVGPNGTLSFFMGNGVANSYGLIIPGPLLRPNVWYHVGFSIQTLAGQSNPVGATLFAGAEYYIYRPWGNGQRQERKHQAIVLGDYINQDGDNKYFSGVIDEVRFWSGVRTQEDLGEWATTPVPQFGSRVPLAYYNFNTGAGNALIDSSPNQFHGFIHSGSPNVSYVLSGVKVDVYEKVGLSEAKVITLPGLSVDGPLGFTYTIMSYPTDAEGNVIGNLTTPEGVLVQYLPFSLLGNQVVYTAPANLITNVTFQYLGGGGSCLREETPTTVYVEVGEPCPNGFCTRCSAGGAQGTCGGLSLPYFDYTFSQIERILFLFEVEKTLNTLDTLESKIEQLMTGIASYPSSQDLSSLIKEIGEFNTGCLQNFCETFFGLLQSLPK